MKKKTKKIIFWTILISSILILAGVIVYGGLNSWFSGWFQFTIKVPQPFTPTPDKVKEYLSYSVYLTLNPSNMCVGQSSTGTINSNIFNGICSIFIQNSGSWTLYSNVNLNSNGYYSETQRVDTPGIASFQAVCCDSQDNCKISNQVTLTVRICDNDGDGIPDDTDPDDDNDGYSDEEEIEAGTDPLDATSHPSGTGCNAQCISKGFVSGRGPFESGSSCIGTEVIEYLAGESGLICCCLPEAEPIICYDSDSGLSPFEEQLKTAGTCTDSTGTYYDSCIDGNHLSELYCGPLGLAPELRHCMGFPAEGSQNCPGWIPGSTCDAGKCVLPSGGGTMTDAECQTWMSSLGKQYWLNHINNIDDCGGWAWTGCQSIGKTLLYFDFSNGCCVWSCA